MTGPAPGPPRRAATLLLAVLVLTSLNLRTAVTSIGALLRDIQADLAMTDTVAGILTALPVLTFGLVGLLAGRVGRRLGTDAAIVAAQVVLVAGLALRALAPTSWLLMATSLLALIGIAVANVLVPVAVKRWFPDDIGRATGWYSMAVVASGGLPAATSVPIAEALGGWRPGLAAWAVPALVALLVWVLVPRPRATTPSTDASATSPGIPTAASSTGADARRAARRVAAGDARVAARSVRRSGKAWALALFFGLQALEAYVAMGWLSALLQDAGVSAARAGLLLSVVVVLGAPIALVIPRLAARSDDQRRLVVVLTAASMAAYVGLLVAPGRVPLLWSLLLGVGLGAFPLALVLLGLRAASDEVTASLSSLVQGAGYLLAAVGPVTVGALHDLTGGWTAPLLVLLVLMVPKGLAGLVASSPGTIGAGPGPGPTGGPEARATGRRGVNARTDRP